MRQGAGRQADAIKLIDKALSFKKEVRAARGMYFVFVFMVVFTCRVC
jgi:hypothetical protein